MNLSPSLIQTRSSSPFTNHAIRSFNCSTVSSWSVPAVVFTTGQPAMSSPSSPRSATNAKNTTILLISFSMFPKAIDQQHRRARLPPAARPLNSSIFQSTFCSTKPIYDRKHGNRFKTPSSKRSIRPTTSSRTNPCLSNLV